MATVLVALNTGLYCGHIELPARLLGFILRIAGNGKSSDGPCNESRMTETELHNIDSIG
jgi:hypothetical protein